MGFWHFAKLVVHWHYCFSAFWHPLMRHTHPLAPLAAALLACFFASSTAAIGAEGPGATTMKMADPSQLAGARSNDAARPAVGVPLIAAENLIKEGRFIEALAKVREAEKAAVELSTYEQYAVARVKAAAARGAGQHELSFTATETAIATNRLNGAEQLDLIASLIHAAYGAKDYPRAARWADRYLKDGGTQADISPLRIQALYLAGDYAAVAAALQAQVQADDAAGRATSERELQLLHSAQRKAKDEAGALRTIERLATHHAKPAYWSELLARVDRQSLPDRLFIDFFRIARASGNLGRADQALAHAELALASTLPGEALAVLHEANAKGLFKDADAARYRTLRDKATKHLAEDTAARPKDEAAARAARDGNAFAMLGQALAGEGKLDAGIAAMEQALAKGGLKHPDELKLRLGEAQALAGRGPAAVQTLAGVKGGKGLGELAQLWSLYASRKPVGPANDMAGSAPAAAKTP